MANPIEYRNGKATWTRKNGDLYIATGVDANGKRFRPITSHLWSIIQGVNLYRGTKWLKRGGKRYIITQVTN